MIDTISILRIVEDTIVDGVGLRTSIYAAGCSHHCQGCHNPESWDISNGTLYSIESIMKVIKDADFSNVTFTGGDPLYQVEGFTALAVRIKAETNKNIWCYTGYTFEEVVSDKHLSQILPYIDVMVDGRFEISLRDETLKFRGSSNQRIINVQKILNLHNG
ncbi:MAG: anaerobic ribonucleoside-triphosphate reductase activating protein [Bacteroidales bacterium]|jgi:anaerobic ribonucleoside-triphosphate reductase activating protein